MSKETLPLFDSDDESSNPQSLNIINVENDYANKYSDWRRKEELQHLKDKYGDTLDVMSEIDDHSGSDDGESGDEDEESDSSSDSLEEEVFDEEFLNVYSALKSKDPKIYENNFKFTQTANGVGNKEKARETSKIKNSDKMTLTDYHRKLIEEKKGITEEDETMNLPAEEENVKKPNSYYEELYNIRKEIVDIVKQGENEQPEESSDDEELFSIKNKTAKQQKLANGSKKDMLSKVWSDDKKLDEGEQFLRDYIVNERYLDDEKRLVSDVKNFQHVDSHFGGFDADQNEEKTSEEETKETDKKKRLSDLIQVANYHYEEEDATLIKRYPRTVNSIRDSVKDTKSKRAEVRERKKKEKETELKRLRKLKREEMESKLNKLKQVSGMEKVNFKELDLNVIMDEQNDFDPDKYDEKMRQLFDDAYYNQDADKNKPTFEYIPEIDDELKEEMVSF